jgi:hypothetical protein
LALVDLMQRFHEKIRWKKPVDIQNLIFFIINYRMRASDVTTLTVRMGAHNLKESAREAGVQNHGVKLVVKHKDFTMETLVRSTELPWAFFIAPFHQFLIFVNFQELFYPDNKEFLFFFSIVILLFWY